MSKHKKAQDSRDIPSIVITSEIATLSLKDEKSVQDKPIPPRSYMVDRG